MTAQENSPLKNLIALARLASHRAHSPYSGYKVGAAVELESGAVYTGCNVENASYGATVCAERVALWKAVSEESQSASLPSPRLCIRQMVVYVEEGNPWPPCGMCRQVISEFAQSHSLIHCANHLGQVETWTFAELFPKAFGPDNLRPQSSE